MFMTASFLENHEHPRFPSLTQDPAVSSWIIVYFSYIYLTISLQLIKNAMAWPFVQDGIPMLYYGKYLIFVFTLLT